jgi:hypothetical protein
MLCLEIILATISNSIVEPKGSCAFGILGAEDLLTSQILGFKAKALSGLKWSEKMKFE